MYTTFSLRSGYIHRKITSKSKYRENRLPIFNDKCDMLIFNDREKIYNDCKKDSRYFHCKDIEEQMHKL